MRPVDLLPGAAHAFFDGTFDQTTGAIMLKIEDYKEKVAKAAPNRNGYNEIYTYFRNNYLWGPDRGPTLPPFPVRSPRSHCRVSF